MAEKDATARLRRAVKENNLFLVKRLLKRTDMRNPDPTNKRYTSLAWAAVLGHEETFEFLLSSGHDDHEYSKDSENNTILILLAGARPPIIDLYGTAPSDAEFLRATLRMARLYYDRYPNTLDWANLEGKTALHIAALKGNEELVRMLCDLGADVDLADNDGNTPLHYASAWGHIPVVQLLIDRGCQYLARNNEGFTPSDYAYSVSTRDTLQDTARAQFELKKKARQVLPRSNDWSGLPSPLPPTPPPKPYAFSNSSVRIRSGSGTSRTTTTSDSDLADMAVPGPSTRSRPSFGSSFSPSRRPVGLPGGSSSGSTFFSPQPPSASSFVSSMDPAAALSPIATRTLERDADAMEKYKLRQRSGSATTTSTDDPSQNGSLPSALNPSSGQESDNMKTLGSMMTVGSVAPRRRLRPSASAAQLHSPQPPSSSPNGGMTPQDPSRHRSGTSPANLKTPFVTSEPQGVSTPTQASSRPLLARAGNSLELPEGSFTGPPSEYAKFPPPPSDSEPERATTPTTTTPTTTTPTTTTPTHSRRLPFNILSSHKTSIDSHVVAGHRRNASANTAVR